MAQANIASITVNDNGNNLTTTLSPNFNPSITSYSLIVNNNVAEVEFIPTLTDAAGATSVITPADSNTGENHQVEVTAGRATTVTIVVTAEDRTTTNSYTFNVYRKRGGRGPIRCGHAVHAED